jgi:hypothetical protein
MPSYDPRAPYWVVYQYSEGKCPYIFTTNDFDEFKNFVEDVPGIIVRKSEDD